MMLRMELGTRPPVDGFAVDAALTQSSKDQVPELVIAPASQDPKIGAAGVPQVSIKVPTPPATHGDSLLLERGDLPQADPAVDTVKSDLKPCGTHIHSESDHLTDQVNENVAKNAVSSYSAGFMDKIAPPPTTVNGHIEEIFASPATRLKRRLEETKDLIVCPGVYDGFSARIALSVGCDAMYMVSEPPDTGDRQTKYHLDRCWNHRLSARHGGFRSCHTQ